MRWLIALALSLIIGSAAGAQTLLPSTALTSIAVPLGWTYYQATDTAGQPTPCAASGSSCTIQTAPSCSGCMKVIFTANGSAGTITSAASTGDTWVHPTGANACSNAGGLDCIYAVSGASGNTSVAVTITWTGGMELYYLEFKPPIGYSGSFDASGQVYNQFACLPCNGAGLPITATDVIVQADSAFFTNAIVPAGWQPSNWGGGGYSADWLGFGEGLNVTNGAAPYVTGSNYPTSATQPGPAAYSAVAFKSSAGSFTTPAPLFTLANAPDNQSITCSNSCSPSIIVNSTAGNLGILSVMSQTAGTFITSASINGGAFTVPAGCQQSSATAKAISCAYTLSSTGGASTIALTMNGPGTIWWDYVEVHRSSGSWVLDGTICAATNTTSVTPAGCAITGITGTNDVEFQAIQEQGAVPYAQTMLSGGYNGGGNQNSTGWGSSSYNLNMSAANAGVAPIWLSNLTEVSVVFGLAFK